MPADDATNEAKQVELSYLMMDVLASLPQTRIVDQVMLVGAAQHLAFLAYPDNPVYMERLLDHILALADLAERAGQLPLATELRSLVEGWRTPELQ